MKAGTLRHRIAFQRSSRTQNPNGFNPQNTWGELAKVWADVRGLSGTQLSLMQGNTETATATHSIKCRWRGDIKVTDRIAFCLSAGDDGLSDSSSDEISIESLDDVSTLQLDSNASTKYFRINKMLDPDGRRRELNIVATEIAA